MENIHDTQSGKTSQEPLAVTKEKTSESYSKNLAEALSWAEFEV